MITLDKLLKELNSASLTEIVAGCGRTNKNRSNKSGSSSKKSHSNKSSSHKKSKGKKGKKCSCSCVSPALLPE